MTRACHDSPVEYDCPHCGQGYEIGANDAIFIDNIEDECETTCDKCNGKFQLYCHSIEVEMRTQIAESVYTLPRNSTGF